MFQKILIPLDGSPRAELILHQVAQLWKREGSELILVHAISAADPARGGSDSPSGVERRRDEAEVYLRGVARRYMDAGAKVRTRVVEGSASGAIVDAAGREGATMIAMTTHGRTGILRWLMGSVADTVLRASEVPVLLLRPLHRARPASVEPAPFAETPFRRILIATDGSALSLAIVDPAMQFASVFGSEIIALHVWDSYVLDGGPLAGMEAGMPPPSEAPLSSEDEVTEEVARRVAPSGLKVTRVTRYGEPASEILDHCREHGVELIALAIHEGWELSRWMAGSMAERVLRFAEVPVLVVRAVGSASHAVVEGKPS